MKAYRTTNVTPGLNAVIKYDTVDYDSHGAYSTTTGLFTCPISGTYEVAMTTLGTTTAGGAYISKSGVADVYVAPFNTTNSAGGSMKVKALAGQTLAPFMDTATTVVVGSASAPRINAVTITRVGNY
jgi:hypothetical protein